MEIKAVLNKPYSDNDRMNFIVENNHRLCYEIRETENSLEAWGYTQGEIEQQEQERIGGLNMTRGDFFEAMLYARQIGKSQLRALIENSESIPAEVKPIYLNRFDEAINFYRKYPVFDLLCKELDITTQQLDSFFESKDWHDLLPVGNSGN